MDDGVGGGRQHDVVSKTGRGVERSVTAASTHVGVERRKQQANVKGTTQWCSRRQA